MATRKELIQVVRARYRSSARMERQSILEEFLRLTGYHRKHAIRVLGAEPAPARDRRRPDRLYDEDVRQALIVLWEAADRICGKRLKALLPALVDAMERHGRLSLAPGVKGRLLAMSPATIDRALSGIRVQAYGGAGVVPARAPRSGARCPCAPSPTGRIPSRAISRSTWWSTAAASSRTATSCIASC